ncbi:hypothetical protein Tco_1200085, partial [Tanacetum coccineum]
MLMTRIVMTYPWLKRFWWQIFQAVIQMSSLSNAYAHDTHKQALGYQNPLYLKKAQQIKPTLYDGSVIAKEHAVNSVIDDEETLILEEESLLKMLDKQNYPISIKQKINISPIDYSKLNNIKKILVNVLLLKKLSAKQAFWLKHSFISETLVKSHTPVRIEAPSELPKVGLVNESLKNLKYQLTIFDKVVKKRTTSDAITADKNDFEIQIKQLRINNDQLLNQIMSQEIVHTVVNSVDVFYASSSSVDECNKCLVLETELFKKKDFVEKDVYDKLLEHSVAKLLFENENLRKEREHLKSIYKDQFDSIRKTRVQSKEQCASLIAQINAKSVENSDLNAQLQERVFAIAALKNELRKLKGKNVFDTAVSKPCEKLVVVTLMNKDKKVRFVELVTSSSNIPKQTDSFRTKDSNKPLLTSTGVNILPSVSGSKPSGNTKKNRISRRPSSNQKNKIEERPKKVKSSLNKMNSVSEPISNAHVKHSVKNAKFESICAICNKCLFDANHDMCVIDYVNDVNV